MSGETETLIDIRAPLEQEGTKATLRAWFKRVGEALAENEPLAELETDKVAVEIASPCAGVLAEIRAAPNTDIHPGEVIARLRAEGAAASPAPTSPAILAPPPAGAEPELRLSPAVRRLLSETGLDPRAISGTGRGGRLTREDVAAAAARPAPAASETAATPGRVPHSPMRRRIAEHMSRSLATAPHVTAVFEADFTAVAAHRARNKAEFARAGAHLTFTAYAVAAAVQAMAAAPAVNSRWHDDFLELFSDVNIGIGTALGVDGLVVPVIHRAQTLSLLGIAQRLTELTERARSNRLTPADMRDGTFSISNHGVSGTLVATPIIINQPQSAILGLGKLERRVVVRDVDGIDTIQIRPMAYVSLTIDHRALDGAQTNAWLSHFVATLESWA